MAPERKGMDFEPPSRRPLDADTVAAGLRGQLRARSMAARLPADIPDHRLAERGLRADLPMS